MVTSRAALAKYETDPRRIFNMRQPNETELSKIPPKICCNLVESIPRRIAEVLNAKGSYTKILYGVNNYSFFKF